MATAFLWSQRKALAKLMLRRSHQDLYAKFPVEHFSNSYIDLSFIKNITYQPADQHNAYRKKKRAEIDSRMYVNVLIQPAVKRLMIGSDRGKIKKRHT